MALDRGIFVGSTMRIDAHQHFWKYTPAEYGWINNEMSILKRDFLPGDLEPQISAQGFSGSIAVQARQNIEETRWLLNLAAQNEFVKGVVGWVDLCSPDLSKQLEEFTAHPKFVGVRHVLQDEPDREFMLRREFRRGISILAEQSLAYDLLLHPRHLLTAVTLVEEFPQQRFVLDHIAKPPIANGVIAPWDRDLRVLAKFENVCCKLSGMVTEARWHKWKLNDFWPYLDTVFDAFGPARLMIGSDWPVCTLAATYGETLGIVSDYINRLTSSEHEAIFGKNCASFYRL
jgi:L-fuconolactonase